MTINGINSTFQQSASYRLFMNDYYLYIFFLNVTGQRFDDLRDFLLKKYSCV